MRASVLRAAPDDRLPAAPGDPRASPPIAADVGAIQLRDRLAAEQLHRPDEVGAQDLDRARHAGPAGGAQAVGVGAADQHRARAEAQRLRRCRCRGGCRRRAALRSGRRPRRPLPAARASSPRTPSSCRPPWLETTIASAPASTARRASSPVWTPLMTIGPFQSSRIHSRSSQVTIDCSSASADVGVRHRSVRQHDVGEVHQAAVAEERRQPARPREELPDVGQHRPRAARQQLLGAVAEIALAHAGDRRVDRDDQRGVAGVLARAAIVALARRRGRRTDTAGTRPGPASTSSRLRAGSPRASTGVDRAGGSGRARRDFLAARLEHAAAADRREDERQRESACRAPSSAGRVPASRPRSAAGSVMSSKARHVLAQRDFAVRAAVDVVEHGSRQPPARAARRRSSMFDGAVDSVACLGPYYDGPAPPYDVDCPGFRSTTRSAARGSARRPRRCRSCCCSVALGRPRVARAPRRARRAGRRRWRCRSSSTACRSATATATAALRRRLRLSADRLDRPQRRLSLQPDGRDRTVRNRQGVGRPPVRAIAASRRCSSRSRSARSSRGRRVSARRSRSARRC